MSRKPIRILLAAGMVAMGAASVAVASAAPNRFATELLDAHNHARLQNGAQPLVWSKDIAHQAHRQAQVMAREGGRGQPSEGGVTGAGEGKGREGQVGRR